MIDTIEPKIITQNSFNVFLPRLIILTEEEAQTCKFKHEDLVLNIENNILEELDNNQFDIIRTRYPLIIDFIKSLSKCSKEENLYITFCLVREKTNENKIVFHIRYTKNIWDKNNEN